jgi:hypothetical protein
VFNAAGCSAPSLAWKPLDWTGLAWPQNRVQAVDFLQASNIYQHSWNLQSPKPSMPQGSQGREWVANGMRGLEAHEKTGW